MAGSDNLQSFIHCDENTANQLTIHNKHKNGMLRYISQKHPGANILFTDDDRGNLNNAKLDGFAVKPLKYPSPTCTMQ